MHNLSGRTSAQLGVFSGTVTLASPDNLPAGGSPRNQNMDFTVGSAVTRGPLINPFTYESNSAGPSPGGTAGNAHITGNPWTNPSYVLANDALYATSAQPVVGGVSISPTSVLSTGRGTPWVNISNVLSSSGYASCGPTSGTSNSLQISGINFAIPSTAVIVGVVVSFQGYGAGGQLTAELVSSGVLGSPKSVNLASSASPIVFGSSSDLWGYSGFTPALFNSGQVGITVSTSPISGSYEAFLNSASITVYYSTFGSDALQVEQFGFSVPSTATPQGFAITINGYATTAATLNVQMLKAGVPTGSIRTVSLPVGSANTVTVGGINDLFGAGWVYSDLNSTQFGLQLTISLSGTAFVGYVTLTAYFLPTLENFNYVTTFEDSFGNIRTLALDSSGEWWIENVTQTPGVLAPLFSGPPANSFASSFTADSRQYIATSDLSQGSYIPQQYTGQWTDRVSQVGPGAAPTFTPILATGDTFAIATITQPAAQTHGSSYFLQSSGPGSTAPGNVVTIYYSDSTLAGPDTDLVAAFNSGYAVYVYTSFTGGPSTQGPYTVQVTSVNEGQPPGQPRQFYYFTYNVPTVAFTYYQGSGHPGYTANYQRSLATMTTSVPVPGLEIGGQSTVTGSSVASYDNTWTITQTPNAGSFNITQTAVASGVATYSYTLVNGAVPAAGQLITITGTNNDDGLLNLVNATIVSASGGSSGTFTINVSLPNATAEAEQGQATTAGTIFGFDPGAAAAGSSTNPIYGNATGGTITFAASGQFVSAGTRKGTVFFITRNGFYTPPAPPVTFACASNTTGIQATNLPIGPPDVIARGIAFTEAGANGVPGANFYTIPQPVQYIVNNVTYVTSSLFIDDNTTTSAVFSFTDAVLLNAEAIDIPGNDLFNLGELGDAAWCTQYAGRSVWGRVRTKIQNFLNLSFDGGFLANPGGNLQPLGWNLVNSTVPNNAPPTLLNSPVFGNSYYMHNTSGSTQNQFCMLYQSAYQDYNQVAILQNQTAYSVRVTCRTPSMATGGALVVDLTAYDIGTGFGQTYGEFVVGLAQITSTMATYQGTLLTTDTLNIPPDLVLRVWGENMPNGADIEVDRIEVFPTLQPTNLTQLVISYQNDWESFDLVTGGQDTTTVNAEPANGGFTLRDQLYVVKESSLGYLSETPNQEPANWSPFKEVSNVAGACGINAYTIDKHKGEEWASMACQNGWFLFNGGAPAPIQLEIQDIWQAINWDGAEGLCICNDIAERKMYAAIPLPIPNPWMVDAEVNANPTTPNVILMLNYEGIGSIDELMNAASMHMTMMGKLAIHDFRRKWSLWTIPAPYLGKVKRSELRNIVMFCNGIESSKIYYLGDTPTGQDDGVPFTSSYCTYGFVDQTQAESNPMFGLYNKRYAYYDLLAQGQGTASLTFYQNTLQAPYPYEVPGGVTLSSPSFNDYEGPLDEFAQRLFAEVVMENGWFSVSRLTLAGADDKWSVIRGI